MSSTHVIINLFGAIALLLFGLAELKDGVSRAFGVKLRAGLATGTRNSLRSFDTGFSATVALQSSTATALMTASFVERALIKPRMAQIVLLGANVGTAVTAWIVSTGIEWLSPLLIFTGMVLYRSSSSARQGGAAALLGIGLMLLSLHLLGAATEPMRQSPALAAFIGLLDNAWPVALAISAAIAFVSSSSLAAVILIMSLSTTGALSPGLTIILVLGANLGGAIPPVIATLSSPPPTRRIALGNLIVRAAGSAIALPLAGFAADLLLTLPFPVTKLPVYAHLAFNILLSTLAWPLSHALSRLMVRLVPDEDGASDHRSKYLDEEELSAPVMALASATRETLGVGDLVERMLVQVRDAFEHKDLLKLKEIPSLERRVDSLQQDVKIYLSKLGREGLTEENGRRSIVILDYAINLEHIGGIVEKGLLPQVTKVASLRLKFSEDGYRELKTLFDLTVDNLRIAQTIL